MACSNGSKEQPDLFDIWAYKRIIAGKKCHLDDHAVCLPVHERDCKICYQEDIARMEKGKPGEEI